MEINQTLYKLLANYLFSKSCDTFLNVKYGIYQLDDIDLADYLIKSKFHTFILHWKF